MAIELKKTIMVVGIELLLRQVFVRETIKKNRPNWLLVTSLVGENHIQNIVLFLTVRIKGLYQIRRW